MSIEHIYELLKDVNDRDQYVKRGDLVRCKDCCWWQRDTVRQNSNDVGWWNEAICEKCSDDIWTAWKPAEWYCADAERRTT